MYVCTRLDRKGVNFGNSLMASGICYMGSEKYFTASPEEKNYNLFYRIMQPKMHLGIQNFVFHFHLTTKSSNGLWLQILGTHGEFQILT